MEKIFQLDGVIYGYSKKFIFRYGVKKRDLLPEEASTKNLIS